MATERKSRFPGGERSLSGKTQKGEKQYEEQ